MVNDEVEREIRKELDKTRVLKWTEALRGFAPKSNKQMELYVKDFPEKGEVFKDIMAFFDKFGRFVSEERLVQIIRSVQSELGRVNFNMAKLAAVKQYMKYFTGEHS